MKKKKPTFSNAEPQLKPLTNAVKRPSPAAKKTVSVDFPVEGEIVRSASYVVRAVTPTSERVEISIDGKDWQPCRESVGFWWFDWSGYNAGPHSLKVRIPSGDKRYTTSKPRQFTVLI